MIYGDEKCQTYSSPNQNKHDNNNIYLCSFWCHIKGKIHDISVVRAQPLVLTWTFTSTTISTSPHHIIVQSGWPKMTYFWITATCCAWVINFTHIPNFHITGSWFIWKSPVLWFISLCGTSFNRKKWCSLVKCVLKSKKNRILYLV